MKKTNTNYRVPQRILSLIFVMVMIFSLIPAPAFAASENNPGVFTVTVTSGGNAVKGASVKYTISGGESDLAGTANTDSNGEAVIAEMAEYEGATSLEYTVSKDGYDSVSKTVSITDKEGNVDVSLTESAPEQVSVTATKTGSGKILLNNQEGSISVDKGSTVSVKVTPASGSIIKSVTIGGTSQKVSDTSSFETTITADSDVSVSAVFVKRYTVTVGTMENGSVTLNGKETSKLTVDENTSVKVAVTPDSGYQISSVAIGGTAQTISNASSFSTTVKVTSDTQITASFVRVYKVTVKYDSAKGTVTTDPTMSGGTVTVKKGSTLSVTAKPNSNYRVSAVSINGEEQSVSGENDSSYSNNSIKPNKDTTITITFSPNQYSVSAKKSNHGSTTVSASKVEHGGSVVITTSPNSGYRLDELTINGKQPEEYSFEQVDENKFKLSNIKEKIEIETSYTEKEALDESAYTFSKDGLLRQKDETNQAVYVYAKGSRISFKSNNSQYNGFRFNGRSTSNPITDSIVVTQLEMKRWYTLGIVDSWSYVDAAIPHNKLALIIDDTAPKASEGDFKLIEPEEANENEYYNSDVNVAINAVDPDDKLASGTYSGIQGVYYWVTCDGNVTQGKEYTENSEDESSEATDETPLTEEEKEAKRLEEGILYEYEATVKDEDGNEIAQEPQQEVRKSFTVNVTETLNNSDNVVVHTVIIDRAGNKTEETKQLKINATRPKVKISMSGTPKADAEDGFYSMDRRTATIVIVDRASCFDKTLAVADLKITADGKDVTDQIANKISWTSDSGASTFLGTVEFPSSAEYKWEYAYTNKAGLANDGYTDTTIKDDTFQFTVDDEAPSAKIYAEADSWVAGAVEKITFGIWKNHSVTVTVKDAEDNQSPLKDILYYKTDSEEVLTGEKLEQLYKEGKFVTGEYTVNADEAFVVYARVTDYAGNALYLGTNGVIVDMTKSRITLEWDKANSSGFYNKNFNVYATVNELDTDEDKDFSGIKTIDYKVIAEVEAGREQVTQEGNLYTFNEEHPTLSQLKKSWTKEQNIVIDAEKNNYNKVWVEVTAEDNAGNKTTKETDSFSINTVPPEISLTYDDNKPNRTTKDGRSYFAKTRTATLTIHDRASTFDESAATEGISIQAVDSEDKALEIDRSSMIGEWSHDGDTHSVDIVFSQDGNYTVGISYQNKAEKAVETVDTKDSVSPYTFTIDKTDPEGTVEVDKQILKKIANILTFGLLFKNTGVEISATASDKTSPVTIEYYKTDNLVTPTRGFLDQQEFKEFNGLTIDPDEQLIVYLKITDYAGNYIYLNSGGYVLDEEPCATELTPAKPNENGVYNTDVKVDVSVRDHAPYSGIKSVVYWVENNGTVSQQESTIYSFDVENPTQKQLVDSWTGSFTVDAAANNSSNVVAYVKTTDNAGNESIESVPLDIDITQPSIKVTYADTANGGAVEGYLTSRTATIVITERNNHFNANKATNGIKITAADGSGKEIRDSFTISGWKTSVNESAPDKTTHTATVSYNKDANYTFDISYTDDADNKNSEVNVEGQTAPYKFTVDATAPTGTVTAKSAEGRQETWNGIVEDLYFGFWSKSKISLSGTSKDRTSPIQSVQYYMPSTADGGDPGAVMTRESLDKVTTWNDFDGMDVTSDKQFAVYLKIMDNAGNYTYVGTNGLEVDKTHPDVESVAPSITTNPKQPINGIYNGDVKVSIKVTDPTEGGAYSGLKNVRYKVFDRDSATPNKATQEGTLYSFDQNNPKQKDLKESWTGEITIDSKKNNSNNIQIVVYATDNAGNGTDTSQSSSKSYRVIKIDTTRPTIDISFNNNSADSGKYFKAARTATIKITERNFNAADVKVNITNSDGKAPAVSEWKTVTGTNNKDNSTHVATVTFATDGDYTFNVGYTDLAGNKAEAARFANGSVSSNTFTIDRTNPTISVSYDNNSAQNGNYYKAARTATITIREHNFSADRVKISITATDDGKAIAIPAVRGWSNNGDTHTATISYSADGLYTFNISYTDLAGNAAAAFSQQQFYVDKTTPVLKITGVEDKSANSGEVKPVITCSDTNLDMQKISIKLEGANQGEVKLDGAYSDIHNGKVFTFNNFPEKKNADDIYTLTASLVDKAGNTVTETITFSVNRFGSTYMLSDDTKRLNGTYVTKPRDVVISEINPNKLHNIKVTLFKNDKTITLKEDVDYTVRVIGGEGKWYEYVYKILAKNFEKDGVYRVVLHSEDEAGNVSENTLDTKTSDLEFGIDDKKPTLSLLNLKDGKTYATELLTVQGSVDDNLQLAELRVILDGEEYAVWKDKDLEEIIKNGGLFNFDVSGDSTQAHYVTVIATDAAGNEISREVKRFYVTTNLWVRFFTNKWLFNGTMAALGALALFFLFLWKRRKDEDEDEETA